MRLLSILAVALGCAAVLVVAGGEDKLTAHQTDEQVRLTEDISDMNADTEYRHTNLSLVEYQEKDADGYAFFKIQFEATFVIPYENATAGSGSATVYMPGDSSCNASYSKQDCTQITMDCSFAADNTQPANLWTFYMEFSVTSNDGDKTNLCEPSEQSDWKIEYEVTGVSLLYYTDDNIFPHEKATPSEEVEVSNSSLALFEVSGDSSYKCDHSQTIQLQGTQGSLSVQLQKFQSQAFQISSQQDDTANFDTAKTCDLDDDGSSLVPIVVGCVLAGLIVITLIAYFIGRWHQNKQGNYQAL